MTTPNQHEPTGSITDYGEWGDVQDRSREDWEAGINAEWQGKFPAARGFGGFLSQVLQGLFGGGGVWGTLSGLLNIQWGRIDNAEEAVVSHQSKLQKLEGVIGYVSAYMNATESTTIFGTKKKMLFNTQVGPREGVEPTGDGGWTMLTQGLWRADVQMTFDVYAIGAKALDMDIRVYHPDGWLFDQKFYHDDTGSYVTRSNIFSFAVPGPGYKVYVYAQCAVKRGMLGGPNRTGFNLTKVSSETY